MLANQFSLSELQPYLRDHPGRGSLRIQVTTALGALPVKQAVTEVAILLGDNRIPIYRKLTDESGLAEGFVLPAKPAGASQEADTARDSITMYRISVSHPGYLPLNDKPVEVFANIKTILPVVLEPILL